MCKFRHDSKYICRFKMPEFLSKYTHRNDGIRLSSQRMLALLNSLLDFFRLDNGKERLVSIPFRLEDIAHTLKVEFQNMAENKNLCLVIENNADIVL